MKKEVPLGLANRLVGTLKLIRTSLALFFCSGYQEYYEFDAIFKRSTPFQFYNLLEANQGNLLDIGCGDGDSFNLLSPEIFPIGVEISYTRAKRINKHASAILANAEDLPIKDETIDFVIASEILEHLPNPLNCLNEAHRVLKSNGKLGVTVPNDRVFKLQRLTTLKEFWKIIAYRHQHLHDLNLTEISGLLSTNGFTILKVYPEKREWKMLRMMNRIDSFHWHIVAKKH